MSEPAPQDAGIAGARHLLAASRGVPIGDGCECCVCGASPYSPVPRRSVLGPNFVDFDLLVAPRSAVACEGCRSILGGRPGDDPPPLRTQHCLAVEGEPAHYPPTAGLAAILTDPPPGRFVVVWSASRKKHASLRAGVSTPERLAVGSDDGTIVYVPAEHRDALDAASRLAGAFPRAAIVSGQYHPKGVVRYGAAEWAADEAIVSAYRGQPILSLLAAVVPRGEHQQEDNPLIDPTDRQAAQLLAYVAQSSAYRGEHGSEFWGGFFAHRLERFRSQPLATCLARLMAACQTAPAAESTQLLTAALESMTDEQTADVERALRERSALLVALAYDMIVRRTAA